MSGDFDKEFMYIRRLDRWDSCHGPVINGGIINWQGDKNKNVGKLCEIIRKENGWEIIVSGQMLNGDILGTVSKYINLSD